MRTSATLRWADPARVCGSAGSGPYRPPSPWVDPEYYVAGTEADLARAPQNDTRVKCTRSDLLVAYGR